VEKKTKPPAKKRGEGDWSLHATRTSSMEVAASEDGKPVANKKMKKYVSMSFDIEGTGDDEDF